MITNTVAREDGEPERVAEDGCLNAWRHRFAAGGRYACDLLYTHWFIVGVGLAIGLAAAVPQFAKNGGWIRAEYTIKYGAVIVIFFLSGLSLKTRVLLNAAQRAHLHLLIQLLCLGLTPLIGYGVASAMRRGDWINQDLVSGLVVCTSMPTTVSTNVVFTRQAGGSEAVALINAVIGNVIGIFVSPSLLLLYLGRASSAPFEQVLTQLSITVIAPLFVGQVTQYLAPKAVAWLQARINFSHVSNIMILLLVWNTFSGTFSSSVSADAGSLVLVIAVCLMLYPFFTVLCFGCARGLAAQRLLQALFKVSRADTVAVTMCGATKTLALGMPLIGVLYGKQANSALLALPLIVYHAIQILLGNLIIQPLKRWVNAEAALPTKEGSTQGGGGADQAPAGNGSTTRNATPDNGGNGNGNSPYFTPTGSTLESDESSGLGGSGGGGGTVATKLGAAGATALNGAGGDGGGGGGGVPPASGGNAAAVISLGGIHPGSGRTPQVTSSGIGSSGIGSSGIGGGGVVLRGGMVSELPPGLTLDVAKGVKLGPRPLVTAKRRRRRHLLQSCLRDNPVYDLHEIAEQSEDGSCEGGSAAEISDDEEEEVEVEGLGQASNLCDAFKQAARRLSYGDARDRGGSSGGDGGENVGDEVAIYISPNSSLDSQLSNDLEDGGSPESPRTPDFSTPLACFPPRAVDFDAAVDAAAAAASATHQECSAQPKRGPRSQSVVITPRAIGVETDIQPCSPDCALSREDIDVECHASCRLVPTPPEHASSPFARRSGSASRSGSGSGGSGSSKSWGVSSPGGSPIKAAVAAVRRRADSMRHAITVHPGLALLSLATASSPSHTRMRAGGEPGPAGWHESGSSGHSGAGSRSTGALIALRPTTTASSSSVWC